MQQLASPADTPAPTPEQKFTDTEFLKGLSKVWLARIQKGSGGMVFSKTQDPDEPVMEKWVVHLARQRSEEYPQFETEVSVRIRMDCPLVSIQSEKENIDYLRKALTELTCPYVKKPKEGVYQGQTRFDHKGHEVRVLFTAWWNVPNKSGQSSLRSVPNSVTGLQAEFLWDGTNTPSDPSNPGSPF